MYRKSWRKVGTSNKHIQTEPSKCTFNCIVTTYHSKRDFSYLKTRIGQRISLEDAIQNNKAEANEKQHNLERHDMAK